MMDMSIASDGGKDPGAGAHGVVLSGWNVPYSSVLGAGLRGSIDDDSMHVAGASRKTNGLNSWYEEQRRSSQPPRTRYARLTREGACLETSELSAGPGGGSTRGGMSLHVASESASAFSARFAKGEELNTECVEDGEAAELWTTGSSIPGVEDRDMLGWELVALRRREDGLESERRNAGAEGSVSGAGSDNERRKERAVMGVSKRVTTVGT